MVWPAAATAARTKGRRVVPGRRRVEAVNAAVDALVAHRCKSSTRRAAVALSDTLHVCVRTHDSAVLVAAALTERRQRCVCSSICGCRCHYSYAPIATTRRGVSVGLRRRVVALRDTVGSKEA